MGPVGFNHSFPAIRGMQAGAEFFVAMCPMQLIPKIFVFDDEEVPPELRAQRALNRNRIPEIARYLVENRESYVISAITASVDSSVRFDPYVSSDVSQEALGTLHIPMDARMLINDGQHRRAAIEAAVKQNSQLRNDHVPVLFFLDKGLKRSQQMFADLNKHAIRPSHSLSTLYDHRDPSSEVARFVAMSVEGFKGLTEMEKSSISHRSVKLFTLSGIKHATRALLRKGRNEEISQQEQGIAKEYWSEVFSNVPDWGRAKQRKVASSDLRQNFVHAHGVALQALGIVGADLLAKNTKDWKKKLVKLRTLDWSRTNLDMWEGRAMVMGKISKARNNVMLTANLIKAHLGLELNAIEQALESEFLSR